MNDQTILEIKHKLDGERKEFHCQLCSYTDDEVVVIYPITRDGKVEDLLLPKGTISFGYFWSGRLYNVYHWVTPTGETLGFYFNIGDRTRISREEIYWRDLVVDILITPDGRCRVLDEHELPTDLDADLRRIIETARDEVLRQKDDLVGEIERRSAGYPRG
jgi:predicted RNA-binding protein associated with RNAse of E/G family